MVVTAAVREWLLLVEQRTTAMSMSDAGDERRCLRTVAFIFGSTGRFLGDFELIPLRN